MISKVYHSLFSHGFQLFYMSTKSLELSLAKNCRFVIFACHNSALEKRLDRNEHLLPVLLLAAAVPYHLCSGAAELLWLFVESRVKEQYHPLNPSRTEPFPIYLPRLL